MMIVFCRTFAYQTVTERMPRILAQVVDSLNKLEPSVREKHKDVSCPVALSD